VKVVAPNLSKMQLALAGLAKANRVAERALGGAKRRSLMPHDVYVSRIECTSCSSGVSHGGAQAFQSIVSIAMGAIGAAAGVAAGAAATVGTAGIGIPMTIALPALAGLSAATIGQALSAGGVAVARSIGHAYPDNLYVTVNGTKVFPNNAGWVDVHTGGILNSQSFGGTGTPVSTNLTQDGATRKVQDGWIYAGSPANQASIELWDHDTISSDDHLGTTVVSTTDRNSLQYYVMANEAEESIYIMGVSVS
jgi:hypothetical protein